MTRACAVAVFAALAALLWPSESGAQTCQTQYGPCPMHPATAGTACYCPSPYGPIPGVVTRGSAAATVPQLPNFCCTPAGRLGPYTNTGVPVGGQCYGTTFQGAIMFGQACY